MHIFYKPITTHHVRTLT